MQRFEIVLTGSQSLQVEFLSGEHKGETAAVINQLYGKMEYDELYEQGEKLLVEYRYQDSETVGYARGHYRLGLELALALLFAVALILSAGWTGARALLSFVFAVLLVWKLLIPMLLKGFNPYPVSLFIAAALTASVSFLVGGISRKGLATFAGSFGGLVFASVLAELFSRLFNISGAVRPFGETLLYSGFPGIDLSAIFVCGVFISCSGAVMDLAMDISAAMQEIKHKRPDIHYFEHIASGLRVGRSVIGTMTTTLLLAYSGGYTAMLMYFMGQGIPVAQILNMNIVAAEVLNVLVGSFGLVTVAPFTAVIAVLLYRSSD